MTHSQKSRSHFPVVPLVALVLASVAGAGLVGLRMVLSGHPQYLMLVWNLFLAWLPLLFALGVRRQCRDGAPNLWKLCPLAALWLLFLPNAPYIFTDLVHLNVWFREHYWTDLSLFLLFALTGFVLGFVSLFLMQTIVADRLGRVAGWLFIVVMTGLSGIGIYIGRFLRWNSWDVFVHPIGFSQDLGHIAAHPMANAHSLAISVLFAAFLFLGYMMLYALTHLQPAGIRNF